MMLTSCVVEFAIAEMACVSRNIRTTRSEALALFRSNVPFLSAIAHILLFHLIRKHIQLCSDVLEFSIVVHEEAVLHFAAHHFAREVEAFVTTYFSGNGIYNRTYLRQLNHIAVAFDKLDLGSWFNRIWTIEIVW